MFYCGFMYWSNISFISYCLYESEPCLRRWQLQRCKVSLEYILLILAVFQGFICHFLYTTHSFNSIMNILLILIKTLCNKYYYYCHYTSWDDWDRLITLLTLLVNSKNKKKWTKGNLDLKNSISSISALPLAHNSWGRELSTWMTNRCREWQPFFLDT